MVGGQGGVKPLIEPKQINVPEFNGGLTDGRAKFLEWNERVKDRVGLYNTVLVDAVTEVEMQTNPITAKKSSDMGITKRSSQELHGFFEIF